MKHKIYIHLWSGLAASLLAFGFSSCEGKEVREEAVIVAAKSLEVQDTALKEALQRAGYTFDAIGKLVVDKKVLEAERLDLSGYRVQDFSLLESFPKLKELNLSGSGYGPHFDFALLPKIIERVDLRGNRIYEYDHLVQVEIAENGEETVTPLRKLTKLYLPYEARHNCSDILRYYLKNKAAIDSGALELKMEGVDHQLAAYTTLRAVPDEILRDYLKNTFPSLFTGEEIDLSKHLDSQDRGKSLLIPGFDRDLAQIENLEGVQYIINNPSWEGTQLGVGWDEEPFRVLPYIKPGPSVSMCAFKHLNLEESIDFSGATSLTTLNLLFLKGQKKVDLSHSKYWGQRGIDREIVMFGSYLVVSSCLEVEEIKLPKPAAGAKLHAVTFGLGNLPLIKGIDLSDFSYIHNLSLGDLAPEATVVYPNYTEWPEVMARIHLSLSERIYNLPSTKAFIKKYYIKKADRTEESHTLFIDGDLSTFLHIDTPHHDEWEDEWEKAL